MKVLLLGHKGMLGTDLLTQMRLHHEVVGMDKEEIDITSADDCAKAIDDIAPQIVINAAAYTNVDGCETAREECFAVNAEAVKNIAEACSNKNIQIVHFSTDYVFNGSGSSPYKEDEKCDPINTYGASKLVGECYLQTLAKNYIIIRTAWLYGVYGKNFVRAILEKAKTTQRLTVVDDQLGSPTHTKDLAAAVEHLIEKNASGIFHVTNRGSCSWYQFAVKILQEAGIDDVEVSPIKSDQLARAAKRPAYSIMSMQKFIATTGKAMQPWQLALKDYLESIKSRLHTLT
jgi:dTDP-4-dehydrorhamnose reductase